MSSSDSNVFVQGTSEDHYDKHTYPLVKIEYNCSQSYWVKAIKVFDPSTNQSTSIIFYTVVRTDVSQTSGTCPQID